MLNRTFTPFPILITSRLTLRQLGTTDEEAIFILRSDAEVNKFLDRKKARTIGDSKPFIDSVNDNVNRNAYIYWAITFTGKSELVGTVCLFCFTDADNKCEIGYELLPNYQNHGIMQEAVEKVIDYAFNTVGVGIIEAYFHKDNRRSINLLEKFFFKNLDVPGATGPDLLCYILKIQDYGSYRSVAL